MYEKNKFKGVNLTIENCVETELFIENSLQRTEVWDSLSFPSNLNIICKGEALLLQVRSIEDMQKYEMWNQSQSM